MSAQRVKAERCAICGNVVRVMSYKGTGLCSETCRKIDRGEVVPVVPQQESGGRDS